jgi:cation diffusion facilitator family transporter
MAVTAGPGREHNASLTAVTSLVVALSVLALKLVAWWATGSTALFADMLETVVQVAATTAALLAVRYSALPADENHPYGHAKVEYFSAVLEGALILVAAMLILQESWQVWRQPRPVESAGIGLAFSAAATLVNVTWALTLRQRGKRLASPALVADAHYILSDVVTSAGVIVGVALAAYTGQLWLDPLMAAATAAMILFSGWRLVRDSVAGLMDEAVPADLQARIRASVGKHAEGAIEAHDLRTRRAGRYTFIEFHLVVPAAMTVEAAHAICDRVETALKQELGAALISIHVEPENKAKHQGVLVL